MTSLKHALVSHRIKKTKNKKHKVNVRSDTEGLYA